MPVRTSELDLNVANVSEADPLRKSLRAGHNRRSKVGLRPVVIKVALSAVAWFLAVLWLRFAGGLEVNLVLAVLIGIFVMCFTLFLLIVSMTIEMASGSPSTILVKDRIYEVLPFLS